MPLNAATLNAEVLCKKKVTEHALFEQEVIFSDNFLTDVLFKLHVGITTERIAVLVIPNKCGN